VRPSPETRRCCKDSFPRAQHLSRVCYCALPQPISAQVHATVLHADDLWRGYNFGGKWVFFDTREIKQLGKEDGDPGMVLLGFKDRSRLKLYHNMKAAGFYQPSEVIAGSIVAMEALVESMHRKEKIAICRYRRSVSEVRLVALLPQRREYDPQTETLTMPCGMFVVQLPFAEDLRELKLQAPLYRSDFEPDQFEATKKLVRALALPKGKAPVATAPNPALHKHYAYLQAIATAEKETQRTVDTTLPSPDLLVATEAEQLAFRDAFGFVDAPAGGGAARGAGGAAKRQKTEKVETPTSIGDWVGLWQSGQLDSQTIPVLKAFCKENGLGVGGRKDALTARIHDFLEERTREDSAVGGGTSSGAAAVEEPATTAEDF